MKYISLARIFPIWPAHSSQTWTLEIQEKSNRFQAFSPVRDHLFISPYSILIAVTKVEQEKLAVDHHQLVDILFADWRLFPAELKIRVQKRSASKF